MSKNLFKTYEVNGRTYTDNLGENAIVGIPKKQYIEYEQQREENKQLHSIIKEVREYIKANAMYSETEKICCDDLYTTDCDEVLKILDKVEENK